MLPNNTNNRHRLNNCLKENGDIQILPYIRDVMEWEESCLWVNTSTRYTSIQMNNTQLVSHVKAGCSIPNQFQFLKQF